LTSMSGRRQALTSTAGRCQALTSTASRHRDQALDAYLAAVSNRPGQRGPAKGVRPAQVVNAPLQHLPTPLKERGDSHPNPSLPLASCHGKSIAASSVAMFICSHHDWAKPWIGVRRFHAGERPARSLYAFAALILSVGGRGRGDLCCPMARVQHGR